MTGTRVVKQSAELTVRDVIARRMASQHLSVPASARASELVRMLGAVQAQDYTGAKWGIAQRLNDATQASIDREVDEGENGEEMTDPRPGRGFAAARPLP